MTLDTARSCLRWTLLALLVLAPLPFGSVEPWAVLTLEVAAALLALGALLVMAHDPDGLAPGARRMLLPAALLIGVGMVQLLPLPAVLLRLLSAPTADARSRIAAVVPELAGSWSPISLEPSATTDALLRLAAYVLLGLAAATAFRTRGHLRQVAWAIAASGTFQAIYGSAEYLTGHQHIFAYAKKYYADEASGTFINRNHFAGYLAMTLPFALGLMLDGARRLPKTRSIRERLLGIGEAGSGRLLLGGAAAAAIWVGVILSYSRGGLAVALVGTAFLAYRVTLRRSRAWLLAAALLVPTTLLMWQQVRAPGERFVSERSDLATLSGRVPVWRASLTMVPGHWVAGTGLGTFESAFETYRPPAVVGGWDHAHNDWIEALTDGGPLALGAAAVLLLLALGWRSRGEPGRGESDLVRAAASASIVAIAVYSLADFSLRMPAIALLLAVTVPMAVCRSTSDAPAGGTVLAHRR
ncbi:MAG: O-antigen ligase family protein [Acidobacteriia bacterium]|nr:O-antigen ligase family protein [Terriglobia bacterium]